MTQMSLFRRVFYKNPPDRLVEIAEGVYVFDCCFSSHVMKEGDYKAYFGGIAAQLHDQFPDAFHLVFNFGEGEKRSQISDVLSQCDMTVINYPSHYESCPLLPLERICHFLRSSESWLTVEGGTVLLMHFERSSWPLVAFMLPGLLLHVKQYRGVHKTLATVHKQAPMEELLRLSSPLNPQPSQLRYLHYISTRDFDSGRPPLETPVLMDCLILRDLPRFEGRKGCRPILRVYGKDPKYGGITSSTLLFSSPKTKKHTRLYQQEELILVKLDVQCRVQGDVVVECIHLRDDLVREEMLFRIMFHTAFLLFSGSDAVVPTTATATTSEDENDFDIISPEEFFEGLGRKLMGRVTEAWRSTNVLDPIFDASEIQSLFSAAMPKPEKVRLIDLRRAYNMKIMLTKLKMPLPDMMAAVLEMDDTVLDNDQIENLIKFFPTKEEMELLKSYTGDKANLGKCEQYFLELMKVPRVESKLRVFSFKIQFGTQITKFEKRLHVVSSACDEIRSSQKLKEIMKHILYLGNTLNQGTAKGAAVGFKLESLLKLSDTRAPNSKMTLMHYLCKVLASKASHLLDFYKDLESLESASKIPLKSLAEEMQAISRGLGKLEQELIASESDGPVSEVFRKKLKGFIPIADSRVKPLVRHYYLLATNADALGFYLGEDLNRFPFEQAIATLLKFIKLFKKAQEENVKQAYHRGPEAFGSPPPPPPPPPCPGLWSSSGQVKKWSLKSSEERAYRNS
ncbi:unnamed protein product [Thlaspi arvense]|uniref:Formin-like protein n=1 Tax=Thlaspi arvense TaxID=13288 RepID=A0AAU9STA3_THLAR|nr:unnamed protein product [Thlaspi arvense]